MFNRVLGMSATPVINNLQEGKKGSSKFRKPLAGEGGDNPDRKVLAQNFAIQLQVLGVGEEVGLLEDQEGAPTREAGGRGGAMAA